MAYLKHLLECLKMKRLSHLWCIAANGYSFDCDGVKSWEFWSIGQQKSLKITQVNRRKYIKRL